MKDFEDDGPWMWVAFAPGCRLIIDFIIGPRKQYVADKLLESVSKRLKSIPLFVTDGLKFYVEAILKKYGELTEFPRTGKKGRPKNPKVVPVKDLRYAQVIKDRDGGTCKKVEKKVILETILNKIRSQQAYLRDKISLSGRIITESQERL